MARPPHPPSRPPPRRGAPRAAPSQLSAPNHRQMQDLADLFGQGEYARVVTEAKLLAQQHPRNAFAWKVLGAAYEGLKQPELAMQAMTQALRIDPKDAESLGNLAKVYKDLGQLSLALKTYQQALAIAPHDIDIRGKLLFLLNYHHLLPQAEALQVAQLYGQYLNKKVGTALFTDWPQAMLRSATTPSLRVGMVSGDLCLHPVSFFLENVLAAIQSTQSQHLEVVIYTTRNVEDAMTHRLQSKCALWRSIAKLDDAAAASRIRDDGVQILIDLSGHCAYHRLPMFAYRAAPLQLSWLGYFATTGVAQIDYVLVDALSVPKEQAGFFTERLAYLPKTRLCYGGEQLGYAPEVSPAPALSAHLDPESPSLAHDAGSVRFGCYQNLSKITDEVLDVWSRILTRLPNATLRIQNSQLGDAAVQARLKAQFLQRGISAQRLRLFGLVDYPQYLASHSEVDILLDTFPFPGGTTTCEALWMGVPTVTLAGQTLIARQGLTIMTAAGLSDWVSNNQAEYEQMAIAHASDSANLATLRQQLRERVKTSALFDATGFAKDFAQTLHGLWQTRKREENLDRD